MKSFLLLAFLAPSFFQFSFNDIKPTNAKITTFKAIYKSGGSVIRWRVLLYSQENEMVLQFRDSTLLTPFFISYYNRKANKAQMVTINGDLVNVINPNIGGGGIQSDDKYFKTTKTAIFSGVKCTFFDSEQHAFGGVWINMKEKLEGTARMLGYGNHIPYAFEPKIGTIAVLISLEKNIEVNSEIKIYFDKYKKGD
ncbi:MAG: hypothetical protein ABIO05_05970 [Ferruginibacter sp.]